MEIYAAPNPPEEVRRQQWAVYSDTIWCLLRAGVMTVPALEFVRRQLRSAGRWRRDLVPESHRTQHAMLLDDVVTALAASRPDLRDYYVGAGDLLPSAPEDASALDDSEPT